MADMENYIYLCKRRRYIKIAEGIEALDMFLPGMFAFRSILAGGKSMEIPNLRNKEEREAWRNDTACTSPEVAKDMLLPTCVSGTLDIPDEVYEAVKNVWRKNLHLENGYREAAFKQSSGEEK